MINLKEASQAIRKAAALQGVWSGSVDLVFDLDNQSGPGVIARVYNRNRPDGVKILQGEAENALNYTWNEIKNS